MADMTTANIGFEKQIWDAACVLRGNIDASEYKSVVLGLIFLKYISDRFDEKHQQLVEEGDGFEEDVDEYISEGIFFVPETARWSVIASKAHTAEIGTVIDDAMRAIEKENKRLKDILPKNFARPELDKRRLGDTTLNHTVWEDAKNRIVDLHCFEYTGEGEILYEGDCFPIETFSGKGKIEEIEVSCIEPYSQVMFHLGYEFDENDVHDVKLLCETFHIEIPNEYR